MANIFFKAGLWLFIFPKGKFFLFFYYYIYYFFYITHVKNVRFASHF